LIEEELKELVDDAGYKPCTSAGVDYITEARIMSIIEEANLFPQELR